MDCVIIASTVRLITVIVDLREVQLINLFPDVYSMIYKTSCHFFSPSNCNQEHMYVQHTVRIKDTHAESFNYLTTELF